MICPELTQDVYYWHKSYNWYCFCPVKSLKKVKRTRKSRFQAKGLNSTTLRIRKKWSWLPDLIAPTAGSVTRCSWAQSPLTHTSVGCFQNILQRLVCNTHPAHGRKRIKEFKRPIWFLRSISKHSYNPKRCKYLNFTLYIRLYNRLLQTLIAK